MPNIKWNDQGLVPVIVQDVDTLQVLMLGYMNEISLQQTIDTNLVTFYSRSRQTLWVKGESSGNTLTVSKIQIDCDSDTLLIQAVPAGPTCHTGEVSCFYSNVESTSDVNSVDPENRTAQKRASNSRRTLEELMDTVVDRKANPIEGSYTNYLIDNGLGKILKKVGEESSEIIIAALSENKEELIGEIGDLLYHLTVMMVEKGIDWSEILILLDERASSK